jgi:hypothetical protein
LKKADKKKRKEKTHTPTFSSCVSVSAKIAKDRNLKEKPAKTAKTLEARRNKPFFLLPNMDAKEDQNTSPKPRLPISDPVPLNTYPRVCSFSLLFFSCVSSMPAYVS